MLSADVDKRERCCAFTTHNPFDFNLCGRLNQRARLAAVKSSCAMQRDSDSDDEFGICSIGSAAGPSQCHAKGGLVRKRCKKAVGARSASVEFPEHGKLDQLASKMDLSLFAWPDHMVERFRRLRSPRASSRHRDVTFYSEFSGSGAAEAALDAVVHALDGEGVRVRTTYSADLDPACRSVLLASSQNLSCQRALPSPVSPVASFK